MTPHTHKGAAHRPGSPPASRAAPHGLRGGAAGRARHPVRPARHATAPRRKQRSAMGQPWGPWVLPLGLLQLLGGPAAAACPCRDPRLCHPVTGTGGFEVRVPGARGWGGRPGSGAALPAGGEDRAGEQRAEHAVRRCLVLIACSGVEWVFENPGACDLEGNARAAVGVGLQSAVPAAGLSVAPAAANSDPARGAVRAAGIAEQRGCGLVSSGAGHVTYPAENCPELTRVLSTPFQVFVFDVGKEAWKSYNWSKITTVAAFGKYDPELMCYAHSKGSRIVLKGWLQRENVDVYVTHE